MKRSGIRGLLFAAAIAFGAPSHSALLFSDNFDADSASTVLNFDGLLHWDVVDGTVDYIRSGGFGISCSGGTGGCVDLLGSTGTAGVLVSKQAFHLSADDVAFYTCRHRFPEISDPPRRTSSRSASSTRSPAIW